LDRSDGIRSILIAGAVWHRREHGYWSET